MWNFWLISSFFIRILRKPSLIILETKFLEKPLIRLVIVAVSNFVAQYILYILFHVDNWNL